MFGRSQIDLSLSFAPPPASGAGAARRVNLLGIIVVIPAQNAALGRQVGMTRHVAAFDPPRVLLMRESSGHAFINTRC